MPLSATCRGSRERSPAVIRLSILVQGGALRAPLADPFLRLPGKAGMRAGARSRRPAGTTASGNHPKDAMEQKRVPSPGGQVSGMAATARRRGGRGGWRPGAIPTTSRRAISSRPGGKPGTVRSRDHRGLPPGRELIGLRQVDGMAQREPCSHRRAHRPSRRSHESTDDRGSA